MFIKILAALLTAIPSCISFVDENDVPKHLHYRLKSIARISIVALLTLTCSSAIVISKAHEHRQNNVAFEGLYSSASAQYRVVYFILADKLHQQNPDHYPEAEFDIEEVQLQVSHLTNEITRAAGYLDDALYEDLRLLEHQFGRLISFGPDMDSDTALAQLRMVARSVDNVCKSLDITKHGFGSLCTSTNDYFREGGYWPRLQKIQAQEKQQPREIPRQIRI